MSSDSVSSAALGRDLLDFVSCGKPRGLITELPPYIGVHTKKHPAAFEDCKADRQQMPQTCDRSAVTGDGLWRTRILKVNALHANGAYIVATFSHAVKCIIMFVFTSCRTAHCILNNGVLILWQALI